MLKLTNVTDPDRQMTFELKRWYQPHERGDSEMENTSAFLKGLFHQALEGCNEVGKARLLGDIDTYLEDRNNRFGSKSLVAFVERLEEIKSRPEVAEQELPIEKTYRKELLSPAEVAPWEYGPIKEKSTLGKGTGGTSYLVKVPISESHSTAQVDRVVRVETNPVFYPVDSPAAMQPLMRKGDLAASRFKDEKNIIRPEEYHIAVKENQYSTNMTYWRVPAHELKGFVRDVDQKNADAYIGIYATVMPRAKGKILRDGAGDSPQSISGVTRQIAQGTYKAMTDLHQRGLAHNDLKRASLLHDKKTGGVTLIDTGMTEEFSKRKSQGAYMSPWVTKPEQRHGPETDYYSFACLLLTTTEPDFERVLARIHGHDTGEWKEEKIKREILKDQPPEQYLNSLIAEAKSHSETSDAAFRLEEKMNNYPKFREALMDSFIAGSSQRRSRRGKGSPGTAICNLQTRACFQNDLSQSKTAATRAKLRKVRASFS